MIYSQIVLTSLCLSMYLRAWLPDGYNQTFRSQVFGPSGFWIMAPLRYTAKFDPFLGPPALHPGTIQGKEGIKFFHLATLLRSPLPPSPRTCDANRDRVLRILSASKPRAAYDTPPLSANPLLFKGQLHCITVSAVQRRQTRMVRGCEKFLPAVA